MAHSSNGRKEKNDPLMKMYEVQAMVVEKEEELQQQRVELANTRQEIERLRLINDQQRFDQAIAATEKKFEEQLAEIRRQFEETLVENNAALKESIANLENKIKIDKENYRENMTVIKQSTEENQIEARRLLEREREDRVTTERNFQNQLVEVGQQMAKERMNQVAAERNFQNQLVEVGQQMARERMDRVAAVRKIEAQLAEKGETIDGNRQRFETKIEALQRRIDKQQRFDQAIAATERKFEEQLAGMRRQFEGTLKESIANLEDKIDKENYQENVKNIEAQLAQKGETIGGISQNFETKIETLQRKIDEQSGEIENLRAGQLEKAALVEKANEETKMMMGNISIQLEYVSSELGFHSSALILGGWHDDITDSICIFDSNENKWRRYKQELPFKVARHGSAILNGKIYFMGGHYNNTNEPYASCYKLGESGEWTKMAEMNEKRTGISQSTIVFGSKIWVIGGWRGSNMLKIVEKYNPQTNIWTKMPNSSASIIGEKIFASGGWDGHKPLKSVEVYDPAKNKWEIFCDMPLELSLHCSIVEGTNLIIIGGMKSDGTPSDEVWKINVFDPKKEWIKMASLKQGRYGHGAVKLSNGIMAFGGEIAEKTRIDSVEIFDGISWKEGPKLPEKHGAFSFFPLSIKTEKQLLLQLF